MKRRKFLLTSGTAVIGTGGIGNYNRPVLGLEFNLDAKISKSPSDVSSVLIDFTKFDLVPMYVDESLGNADISITVDVEGSDVLQHSVDQRLVNGKRITKDDLDGIIPVIVDGVPDDMPVVEGSVIVDVDHPSVSQSYSQFFNISDDTTPVAASRLIAWYPFEDKAQDRTAGGSLFGDSTDYSGSVHEATKLDTGGVTDIVEGENSTAYDIGAGEAASRYNDSGSSLSSFTVCSWIKISGINNTYPGIVTAVPSEDDKDYEDGFTFQLHDGALDMESRIITDNQAYGKHSPTNNDITVGDGIPRDKWVHVAWTHDSSTGNNAFYVNGKQEITFGGSSGFSINADRLTIGERYYKNEPSGGYQNSLEGQQDDARIYNTNLSDRQITEIYDRTKP